jgi:cell division protein FtsZ
LLLIVSGSNEITLDEIGRSMIIFKLKQVHNANIIMGVGEDETLGDSIAVTIIATGFDIEQQNGIVNTEPKKIIHTLEDEQRSVHNLSKDSVPAFDLHNESSKSNSDEFVLNYWKTKLRQGSHPVLGNEDYWLRPSLLKLRCYFRVVSPKAC